jgi:hypothetical protein
MNHHAGDMTGAHPTIPNRATASADTQPLAVPLQPARGMEAFGVKYITSGKPLPGPSYQRKEEGRPYGTPHQ